MKNLIKILFLIVSISIFSNSFAIDVVTIKELKENIKILQEKQGEITKRFSSDLGDIENIKSFLKESLDESEKVELNKIILNYNVLKNDIYSKYYEKDEIKKLLLDLKKDTYKKLIPYIEQSKLEDYLNYIKENVEIIKQGKEINEEIVKNKDLLEQKVVQLKEKIKNNEDKLKNEIDILIDKKIDEKIDIIKKNPKFNLLDLEKRKDLIAKTIKNIKEKLNSIEIVDKNFKKIEIYNIVIGKLEKVLTELK